MCSLKVEDEVADKPLPSARKEKGKDKDRERDKERERAGAGQNGALGEASGSAKEPPSPKATAVRRPQRQGQAGRGAEQLAGRLAARVTCGVKRGVARSVSAAQWVRLGPPGARCQILSSPASAVCCDSWQPAPAHCARCEMQTLRSSLPRLHSGTPW